jgi:hypothetical protein
MNGTLLSNEARTATTSSADVNATAGQRGVLLALDVTKAPNTAETLTLQLEAKDPASGKYVPLTAFKASKKGEELGAGTTLLFSIYPGALETEAVGSHEVMGLPLPRKFRVKVTHSAGSEWKYSVGASPLQ